MQRMWVKNHISFQAWIPYSAGFSAGRAGWESAERGAHITNAQQLQTVTLALDDSKWAKLDTNQKLISCIKIQMQKNPPFNCHSRDAKFKNVWFRANLDRKRILTPLECSRSLIFLFVGRRQRRRRLGIIARIKQHTLRQQINILSGGWATCTHNNYYCSLIRLYVWLNYWVFRQTALWKLTQLTFTLL